MGKSLRVYKDFSGGISEVAPDIMLNSELIEAQNAIPQQRGGLSKCKGTTRYNETAFDANGIEVIIEFGKSDGTIVKLVFSGTTVRKWDGTILKNDLPAAPTDWDIYSDVLYWLDGTKFWQYDGTTIAEVTMDVNGDSATWGIIKTCHFIEQRGQRHFFAKKGTSTLYYSEIGNPTYIKATNTIASVTDDADQITALKEFGGALLVFKKNAIFGWFGWTPAVDVEFVRIDAHKGTVSQYTVQRVENMLFYMADDGVYALLTLYTNMISSVDVSDKKIKNIIINAAYKNKACAIYYQGVYRLSICDTGTTNNKEYRYYPPKTDNEKGAWYGAFTHPISCYLIDSNGDLYSGHPTDGLIFKHEQGYNYDGKAIHFKVITKPFDLTELMVIVNNIKKVFVACRQYESESSTLTITIKVDYITKQFILDLDESMVWSEGIWGEAIWGWVDLITKQLNINKKGTRIQITLENNEVDQPVTVYGIAILYKSKKPKGMLTGITEVIN